MIIFPFLKGHPGCQVEKSVEWNKGGVHDQIEHSSSVRGVGSFNKGRGSSEINKWISYSICDGLIRKLKKRITKVD